MHSEQANLPRKLLPGFRIAPMGDLRVYLVSEEELDALERGAPDSKLLTFGIALSSVGMSFGISLLTVQNPATPLLVFLWVATIVGAVNGLLLLLLWWRSSHDVRNLAGKIRSRMPPEGEPELIAEGAVQAIAASSRIEEQNEHL